MTALEFNARVREASRHQRLPGHTRNRENRPPAHKWKVSCDRYVPAPAQDFGINPLTGEPYFSASVFQHEPPPSPRLWRVDVGTGSVNQTPATIEYRRTGDPRGWEMPEGYVPFEAVKNILGSAYPFADRLMWEEPRPFILVTAPSPDNPADLGGFIKTSNVRRPPLFRTAEAWEKDLYQASVWVSVGFWRADPSLDLVRGKEAPRRLTRWRVFAGRFPNSSDSIRVGTAKELARLYLLRDPAHPENDEMHVQQRTYWNLIARTVEPVFGLGSALELAEAATLAVLPLGAGGLALGTALLAAEAALTEILLENLNDVLASTAEIDLWSV